MSLVESVSKNWQAVYFRLSVVCVRSLRRRGVGRQVRQAGGLRVCGCVSPRLAAGADSREPVRAMSRQPQQPRTARRAPMVYPDTSRCWGASDAALAPLYDDVYRGQLTFATSALHCKVLCFCVREPVAPLFTIQPNPAFRSTKVLLSLTVFKSPLALFVELLMLCT